MIAARAPRSEILSSIAALIERHSAGGSCAIMLRDGPYLRCAAASGLPSSFVKALDGIRVGPVAGSCGAAAYTGEAVYTADVAIDPVWVDHRAFVLEHGLRACWSTPIRSSSGEVLGTCALYYPEPRAPSREDTSLIWMATHLAGIAIQRAEEDDVLRRSEQHFRALIENALDLVSVLDTEGTILYASQSSEEVTGYKPEELAGNAGILFVHPDDRPRVEAALTSAAAAPGTRVRADYRLLRQDGSFRFCESIGTHISSGPWGAVTIINTRDITARKQAEDQLRTAKEFLDNLIDSANVMIVQLDLEGRIRVLNRTAEHITGYGVAELEGRCWFDVLVPKQRYPAAWAEFAELLSGRTPGSFESPLVTRSGEERLISWRNSTIRQNGRIVGTLSFGHDITERRQAEEQRAEFQAAVEAAAAEWRRTFDAIDHPLLVADNTGQIRRVNRAARELIGAPYSDIVGSRLSALAAREPWKTALDLAHHVMRSGSGASLRAAGSERAWDVSASLLAGDASQSPSVIVVARDVTTITELEESVRLSETMSAMGALVAGVAHEVRNPLFGISSTLDAFEARFAGQASFGPFIDVLRGEVSRLSALMRSLLEYGKPSPQRFVMGGLGGVIETAIQACSLHAARAAVSLEGRLPDGLPELQLEPGRLAQLLQNLIENAIAHSPSGGRVSVEAVVRGNWLEIGVSDQGRGFAPEDLRRVFEPFFTRRKGGTGLGLSLVQRIAAEHGGSAWAGNNHAGGAIVTVRLPRPEALPIALREPSQDRNSWRDSAAVAPVDRGHRGAT